MAGDVRPSGSTVNRRATRRLGVVLLGVSALLLAVLGLSAWGERFVPASFDLEAARARDLGEVVVGEHLTQGITVREVRFTSRAWDRWGRWRPIRIQAFLAIPRGVYQPRSKPIVITAHGLGAHATPRAAAEICRNLVVIALAVSAPGMGASEGEGVTPEDAKPLFATVPDVRGSWLHAYTYALLRSITLAQLQPEADPEAVVLTGNSIGGIAVLVANGVDDRIRGVLAVSTSGALASATTEGSWLRRLVLSAGLRPEGSEARALFRSLDPLAFADRQRGAVYFLIGAQDEYFPLGQALATYRALQAPAKSLALLADYDHGWYFGTGCPARCMPGGAPRPADCPTSCEARCRVSARAPYCGPQASYNHQEAFIGRWTVLLRSLVARHAARPARPFAAPPPPPTVERRDREVVVHPVGPVPHAVRLAVSDDGGFTYSQFLLARGVDGSYRLRRRVPSSALLFAEVELDDHVVASSIPALPRGFRARVRPFGPRE